MVFPSQANATKTAILQALEKCTSAEKGIGYNKLFNLVHGKVGGSRRTFHKYLNELVTDGAVKKDSDPRHGVGVIIYRTEFATQEEVLIEFAEQLTAISKIEASVKRLRHVWVQQGNPDHLLKAWKLILLSDILGRSLAKLLPSPKLGWHASARIIKSGSMEKVVINMISDDEIGSGGIAFTIIPAGTFRKAEEISTLPS